MKTIKLLFFALSLSLTSVAQTCDLFFSEYLEGASNNKAIEVFNPSANTVNLMDYKIYRFNNGSPTPTDSLQLVGTLASGAVYVAGNPSADPSILNVSDTLHTIAFFNGDDAMMLKNMATGDMLDIVGQIGYDPGANWTVGLGATSEFTLVRKSTIWKGTTSWSQSITEWDIYPQNTFTFIGSHSGQMCCSNTFSTQVASACDSLVSPSGNYVWTSSGIFKDTIQNAAGCDSIITINLTISPSHSSTVNASICNGDSYLLPGGTVVTAAGTYTDTLLSNWGCDSIIITTLTVNPTYSIAVTDSICNGDSYLLPGGVYVTTSGTYVDTLITKLGCDSVITTTITVINLSYTSISDTACESYSWMGSILTTSGIYIDTLINVNGCDSIVTLNLLIVTIDTSVTIAGATMTSNQTGASYQWIDCNNNNAAINGATNQSYTATANGDYAVVVSLNGCVDTSACVKILSIGALELAFHKMLVYPNPADDIVAVSLENLISDLETIYLTDISGRLINPIITIQDKDRVIINMSELCSGIYFVNAILKDGSTSIEKIIKK